MTQKEDAQLLVDRDTFLSAGVHIGTKVRTKDMADFVYKVNPDGLAIMNVEKINERVEMAGKLLSKYEPSKILVVGRRENAWTPIKVFSKIIGATEYSGRYPAGTITNPNLKTYYEPDILVATDPWPDKNAIYDAKLVKVPVIGLCDSNNLTRDVDFIIPCNNKGAKSLALIFRLLARQYLWERGILPREKDLEIPVEKFMEA